MPPSEQERVTTMNHHRQQFHPTMMPPFAQSPHADQGGGDVAPSTPPSSTSSQQQQQSLLVRKPSKHHLEELRKRKRDLEKKFQHRSPTQVDLFPAFAQTSCSSLTDNADDEHDAVTPKKPLPSQMAEWWSSSSSSSSDHSRSVSSSNCDPASNRKPKSTDKASYSSQPVLWDDQESVASKMKLLWR